MGEHHDIPPVFDAAPGPHTMRIEGDLSDPQAEFTHYKFNTGTQAFEKVEKPASLGGVAVGQIAEVLEGNPAEAKPVVPTTSGTATGDLSRNFLAGVIAEADAEQAAAQLVEENRRAVQAAISEAPTVKTGADFLAGIIADADLAEQALASDSREEFVPHSGGTLMTESDAPAPIDTGLEAAEPIEAIPDTPYLRQQLNEQSFVHPGMPEEVRKARMGVRKNWLVKQGYMNTKGEWVGQDDAAEGRPANAGDRLRRRSE